MGLRGITSNPLVIFLSPNQQSLLKTPLSALFFPTIRYVNVKTLLSYLIHPISIHILIMSVKFISYSFSFGFRISIPN